MTTEYSQQDLEHQVSMRLKELKHLKLLNVNIVNAPFYTLTQITTKFQKIVKSKP